MKKRILLFSLTAGMCYLLLSSNSGGPAFVSGVNRTGSQASTTNCGTVGSSCHGVGSGTTVTITLDSGSTATTRYVPGHTYTVKIHGTNTASNPKFGFEFSAVSGAGSSQVQAGTFSGLPSGVAADPLAGLNIVEHSHSLTATSAGVYDESFSWTAPSPGVGTVTLYCTLNAVNGNSSADAGDISGNTSITLTQEAPASVAGITSNINIKAFPNPVNNNLNLTFENAQPGNYAVQVTDMTGRTIYNQDVEVNSLTHTSINTSAWASGIYQVIVERDGNRKTVSVVK